MANVLPYVNHRHYIRNIFSNWHKSFKGDEMKLMLWKVAKGYNIADYNEAIEELEKVNPAVVVGC